jgi:hypothetical protein
MAGRTGQEFNQRKNRKGAFWEDRYHATVVEADFHLIRCMVGKSGTPLNNSISLWIEKEI